jgi:hypothetical protein
VFSEADFELDCIIRLTSLSELRESPKPEYRPFYIKRILDLIALVAIAFDFLSYSYNRLISLISTEENCWSHRGVHLGAEGKRCCIDSCMKKEGVRVARLTSVSGRRDAPCHETNL